jgi:predicted nuclease of predicted toxin-antitoxin system
MRGFLFDENLPSRLKFSPGLPLIAATSIGPSQTDSALWDFARANDLVIITKDADFSARMIVSQPPPRVVHLRFGNMRRGDFHALLARVWPQIEHLLKENKLLNIYSDRIEAVG